jgi:fatty acid desaturase
MAIVEKNLLKEKHQPTWAGTVLWLGFAGVFFSLEGLLLWMMLAGLPWWATMPLLLVLAHIMHSHLIAFHEAAHASLAPNGFVNDALGIFIGLFSFMSLALYRAAHHFHHAHLATLRDEELWPFVDPRNPRWLRRLAAMGELFLGLFYTPFLFLRAFLRKGTQITNSAVRRRIWAELAFLALVWGTVLAVTAWWDGWKLLIVLYAIPALLAGAMQSWRKYIEHVGLTGATPLESTRSIVSPGLFGRFLAFTLLHEPFHGVHHKYARLPHSTLPEFASLLEPGRPSERGPFPSYLQAAKEMLRSLSDPRVGAAWRQLPPTPEPAPPARALRPPFLPGRSIPTANAGCALQSKD